METDKENSSSWLSFVENGEKVRHIYSEADYN